MATCWWPARHERRRRRPRSTWSPPAARRRRWRPTRRRSHRPRRMRRSCATTAASGRSRWRRACACTSMASAVADGDVSRHRWSLAETGAPAMPQPDPRRRGRAGVAARPDALRRGRRSPVSGDWPRQWTAAADGPLRGAPGLRQHARPDQHRHHRGGEDTGRGVRRAAARRPGTLVMPHGQAAATLQRRRVRRQKPGQNAASTCATAST